MAPRSRHRKKPEWPSLVPVCGDRFDAALATMPISRRDAAAHLTSRGIKVASQTLDYIAVGKQQRCREPLLRGIAELTDVPISWLTGEWPRLPLVDWGPFYDRTKDGRLRPARAYLQTWRFLVRCYRAVARDFERGTRQPIEQHPSWPAVRDRAMRLFTRLVEPDHLHCELLKWDDADRPDLEDGEIPASIALAEALLFIVRPWLEDKATLHYGALQYVAAIRRTTSRYPSTSARRLLPTGGDSPDASPLALLRRNKPPWVRLTTL